MSASEKASLVTLRKCTWPIISTVSLTLKDFSRSQAVTYTVKVVISQNRCNIEMLLLHMS